MKITYKMLWFNIIKERPYDNDTKSNDSVNDNLMISKFIIMLLKAIIKPQGEQVDVLYI